MWAKYFQTHVRGTEFSTYHMKFFEKINPFIKVYKCRRIYLKEQPETSAYDFCYSYFSQLQYCNINKDIKVCFSNESYNEEQQIQSNK